MRFDIELFRKFHDTLRLFLMSTESSHSVKFEMVLAVQTKKPVHLTMKRTLISVVVTRTIVYSGRTNAPY